jgi:hypothetical protein
MEKFAMSWGITKANVDFAQSLAVVDFVDGVNSVQVTFQATSKTLDFTALIAQAKQVAADATKNAPTAVIIGKGPKR